MNMRNSPGEVVVPAGACTVGDMEATPDLTSYDIILVNTSAGKDSQAMMDHLYDLAAEAGVTDRLVAVHADLGRVEWEGTRELAEAHAAAYGMPFYAVSRPQGDLLVQVEARGMWPSSQARYCTSDQKTGQVSKVMTALVKAFQEEHGKRQVRILNTLGIRAQESPARAKKAAFEHEKRASNGKRHVDRWLPIHAWSEDEVWARCATARTETHPAYAMGMPRLSCSFCVLASKPALVRAAQLRPELAAEYAAVEARIGHTFRQDLSMATIIELAAEGTAVTITGWAA